MEHEERVPGITFYKSTSSLKHVSTIAAKGSVTLEANVNDFDLWDETMKMFEVMRVYSVDDFRTEIIQVLQEDNRNLKQRLEQQRQELEKYMLLSKNQEEELVQLRQWADELNALTL